VGGGLGRKTNVHFRRKPVLVLVMYWRRAFMRGGSVHMGLSTSTLSTSFERRFRACEQAGQGRMPCWNVPWSVPHRGQVVLGFSSNQEGWAAK